MAQTSSEGLGWDAIPPELAAVARRAGVTPAELIAFRDDPANQHSLPEYDDETWELITGPLETWPPDHGPWADPVAAMRRTPEEGLGSAAAPYAPPATEQEPTSDTGSRSRSISRLDALLRHGRTVAHPGQQVDDDVSTAGVESSATEHRATEHRATEHRATEHGGASATAQYLPSRTRTPRAGATFAGLVLPFLVRGTAVPGAPRPPVCGSTTRRALRRPHHESVGPGRTLVTARGPPGSALGVQRFGHVEELRPAPGDVNGSVGDIEGREESAYARAVPHGELTTRQRALLEAWLPGVEVVRDHSWGLVGTTVLEVRHDGHRYIAEAGDAHDHHLARELRAHRSWLEPWTSRRRAPELVYGDDDAKLIVTRYLDGDLVQGRDEEHRPDTYRQAGRLLAAFHGQAAVDDLEYEALAREKSLRWLAQPHRIDPATEARLRAGLASWPTPPVTLVPTHGDWQPRNWLVHDGEIRAIDFGRTALRPVWSDLTRLAAQQFRADQSFETAFLDGYGADPRQPAAWRRERVREAIGTAVWARQVGDESFERQGHRMIAEVLDHR